MNEKHEDGGSDSYLSKINKLYEVLDKLIDDLLSGKIDIDESKKINKAVGKQLRAMKAELAAMKRGEE